MPFNVNLFFRKLYVGLLISVLIFVPFLLGAYVFMLWNISVTSNLTENDFSNKTVIVRSIKAMNVWKIEHHNSIQYQYLVFTSDEPKILWQIPYKDRVGSNSNTIGLNIGDTIEVKYRTRQLDIATDKGFKGLVERFFSSYGNQVPVYMVTKNRNVLIQQSINAYDEETASLGEIFMGIFVVVYAFIVIKLIKYFKKKGWWFKDQ